MHYRIVLILSVALLFLTACRSEQETEATEPDDDAATVEEVTPEPPTEYSWEEIPEVLEPSTVQILVDLPETLLSWESQASGTGIVYSDDGYIITNSHVVSGASAVAVATSGSSDERSARVVGVSPCDDLAVIQVDSTAGLEPAVLGQSGQERIGAEVASLGYPLADMIGNEMRFSHGSINALNVSLEHFESLVEHSASIDGGNSGGPLVNRKAEVVGVNTMSFNPLVATNRHYAVSIDHAMPIVDILEQGRDRHWLGMNLEPNLFEELHALDVDFGLVVIQVEGGTTASDASVRPGYLLTHLQDRSVNTMEDVCRILRSHRDGDVIKVRFLDALALLGDDLLVQLEGELILGEREANQELQTIDTQQVGQADPDPDLPDPPADAADPDPGDEQAEPPPGDAPTGELTAGRWEGTATVMIDYWAPCGEGGEWIHYRGDVFEHDVLVEVFPPLEGEQNAFRLEAATVPRNREGEFGLFSSLNVSTSTGPLLVEYIDLDYSGYDIGGELIYTGSDIGAVLNSFSSERPTDPCSDRLGYMMMPFAMMPGTELGGYLGPEDGFLEVLGQSTDESRDFLIVMELERVN